MSPSSLSLLFLKPKSSPVYNEGKSGERLSSIEHGHDVRDDLLRSASFEALMVAVENVHGVYWNPVILGDGAADISVGLENHPDG